MGTRLLLAALSLLAVLPAVGSRSAHAGGKGRVQLTVKTKDRVMTAIYKVYAAEKELPGQWLAGAIVTNTGAGTLDGVQIRFRFVGHTEWSGWSPARACQPGRTFAVPYHPVLSRTIAELQSSTPVELRVEWRCSGSDGTDTGEATRTVTFLGGREFVFSDVIDGGGSFQDDFSNAPYMAAWVSRDDPVIKQYAALASRNAGGAAANLSIEQGLETLRASYELMLLNDFVYKAPVAIAETGLSFDQKGVQNVKLPRDVLRDKSGTCIELAILHAAIAHQLGIRAKLALVPGHCFPVFELQEQKDGETVVRRVPLETTGIRGGLRGGITRVGFEKAVEIAEGIEKRSRDAKTYIEIDVQDEWARGIGSPELPPLADDSLERWGITPKGLPGMTLPDIGGGATKTDAPGFSGTWEGAVRARFAGPDLKGYRLTLVVQVLRAQRYRLLATFVADDGGETFQEDSVAEDQDGQLVFQGRSRSRVLATGGSAEIAPGRGAARVKDGGLVGKYGAEGEGFSSFTLRRPKAALK